jgi:NAD(P)-dependent dehydrogenase (short-subunit alcohol dehydrogenase family)
VALVAGAGRGLGRSIALVLGQTGSDLPLVSYTETEFKVVDLSDFDPISS